jgi:hypothetical protein
VANGSGLTVAEVTGLITLFGTMLDRTERNIIARLDDNSRAASERWAAHDRVHDEQREKAVERFLAIEERLDATNRLIVAHLEKEHDEQVAIEARIVPIKTVFTKIAANWRSIALFVFVVLSLLGFTIDFVNGHVTLF